MTEPRIDAQRLAAFLDGELSEAEREAVLTEVAASPDAYAEFIDAAALVREIGVEPAHGAEAPLRRWSGVPPLRKRRVWIVSLAASLAAAAVVAVMMRDGDTITPIQLSAALLSTERGAGSLTRTLGPTWDAVQWPVVRGDTPDVGVGFACRTGALATRLELAARLADTTAVAGTAGLLAAMLAQIDGGAALSGVYQRMARGEAIDDRLRASTIAQTRRLRSTELWFDLGTWLESARLASSVGAVDWFATDGPALTRLRLLIPELRSSSAAIPPAVRASVLSALEALLGLADPTPGVLEEIQRHIRAAFAAATL